MWQTIVTPAATPASIVTQLNREVSTDLDDPGLSAAFAKNGVEPEPSSSEALRARVRDDMEKWREVITGAGIGAK